MAVRTGGPAPYAPPATVLDVVRAFRDRGLPSPITKEVLLRSVVTDSLLPRVLASLDGLDLIDKQGNATPEMIGLRQASSEDFKPRLEALVRSAYADVFQYTDPAKDDKKKVEDAFRLYEPAGQRGRMVSLFLGLCEAAGIVSPGTGRKHTTGSNGGGGGGAKKKGELAARRLPATNQRAYLRSNDAGHIPPALMGLLSSLPPNGAGWTEARRDKFVATFKTVLDFAIPVHDEADADTDEPDFDA
jgi:hypothetical protein